MQVDSTGAAAAVIGGSTAGDPVLAPVRTVVRGKIGILTLERPRTINALTHEMVALVAEALEQWRDDESVSAVVLTGAGERGLCAGGDIRAVYVDALAGGSASIDFWRDEYRLNAFIASFPKPFVALMDGLVMGGGIGLASHASHRVVTERSVVAMPEVGIGFAPDAGGTWLLSRSPGRTGLHAAMTGARFTAPDAIFLGLADVLVPSSRLGELLDRMVADGVDAAIGAVAENPGTGTLAGDRSWIDRCYDEESALAVVSNLQASAIPKALAAVRAIRAASPTAVVATLEAVRRARSLPSLPAVLNLEFGMISAALRSPDLVEGIRAQVIDKDRRPRWSPPRLEEVRPETVRRFFLPPTDPPFPTSNPVDGRG